MKTLIGCAIIITFLYCGSAAAQNKATLPPASANEAPVWTRIVIDKAFSNDGKVWALPEELYNILKANKMAPGKLDKVFALGDGLRDTGLTIEAFLKKYGDGVINTTLQRGVTYHIYGQIGLG